MKDASKTVSRNQWLLLFGFLTIVIAFAISSVMRSNNWILLTAALTRDPFATYDPAAYGIPDMIAGYKVLAVKTAQNTLCLKSGIVRLTLQASEPDIVSFLANSNSQSVRQILNQLDLEMPYDWSLEYVAPGKWDRQAFVTSHAELNEYLRVNGCARLGGAIVKTHTATEENK